ncbi:hypothetical protein Leryth_006043 [Lithospermum erythrorhizon]|nr:hypothetical protein Leryth_006043 [Lithospermum erythrorhizon]
MNLILAPGKYSVDRFDENNYFNCLELFRTDCKITKCGIGGPLISFSGEVIGINFYSEHCTPFLPINIFLKWWSHQKVTRGHCRPSLGMKAWQGLIVEKVLSGSPAETCGLCPGDIVIKCSDTTIVSPLQFFEIVWGMAGKAIEIVVVREGSYKSMKIEVKDITSADEFYQWLLPREYMRRVAY